MKNSYKIRLQQHFFKLATNQRSDKTFLLTSKLCPLGAVCPYPGLYTCIKSWKMYKIRFQREFFETCNKWPNWQTVPVDIKISSPRGCQSLPRAIYMYKILKNVYKIRFQRDVFETCSKWPKWQEVSVDLTCGYIHLLNHVYEVRGCRDLFETCNKWS